MVPREALPTDRGGTGRSRPWSVLYGSLAGTGMRCHGSSIARRFKSTRVDVDGPRFDTSAGPGRVRLDRPRGPRRQLDPRSCRWATRSRMAFSAPTLVPGGYRGRRSTATSPPPGYDAQLRRVSRSRTMNPDPSLPPAVAAPTKGHPGYQIDATGRLRLVHQLPTARTSTSGSPPGTGSYPELTSC